MSIQPISSVRNFYLCQSGVQKVPFSGAFDNFTQKQNLDTNDNKISKDKKIVIAIASALGLLAIGFVVKKCFDVKAANNAWKKAANAAGIEDVNLYKSMRKYFGKITKFEGQSLNLSDILTSVDDVAKKGKISNGDKLYILPADITAEYFTKKCGMNVPKDSVFALIRSADGEKIIHSELFLNNGLGDLKEILPKGKLYEIPLRV